MLKNIKTVGVLVAICTVVALLLALTNQITAPIIAKRESDAANKALLEVMPDGTGFEELKDISKLPDSIVEAYKETSGKGYVFKINATGYKPDMMLMCGVSTDGIITGSVCLSSSETWGFEKTLGDQMKGKNIKTVADVEAGATSKTIKGYRTAMKDALNAATILGGGEADLRSPEEIFNDNLKAALPAGEGDFAKQAIADATNAIDFIYAAKNGAGYVYIIGEQFIGVDAEGNVVTKDISAENGTLAQSKAALAAAHTAVDTTDSGINENITSVQKNAEGNYVIEINGLGFGWFGNPNEYQEAKNIPIQICTVISPDGNMLECLTVAHEESKGYGAAWGTEEYYGQFDGTTIDTYKNVDVVSGATISNNGYLKAIERCFKAVEILEGGAE